MVRKILLAVAYFACSFFLQANLMPRVSQLFALQPNKNIMSIAVFNLQPVCKPESRKVFA
jgi:hypothetical protein